MLWYNMISVCKEQSEGCSHKLFNMVEQPTDQPTSLNPSATTIATYERCHRMHSSGNTLIPRAHLCFVTFLIAWNSITRTEGCKAGKKRWVGGDVVGNVQHLGQDSKTSWPEIAKLCEQFLIVLQKQSLHLGTHRLRVHSSNYGAFKMGADNYKSYSSR